MSKQVHGDARRPDGDLVSGMKPMDRRTDPEPDEFGPKVGWGSDAVFLPPKPEPAREDDATDNPGSES